MMTAGLEASHSLTHTIYGFPFNISNLYSITVGSFVGLQSDAGGMQAS